MKLLMIHACEPTVEAWKEGDYLDYRNIIVWSKVSKRMRLIPIPGVSHTNVSLSCRMMEEGLFLSCHHGTSPSLLTLQIM